MDEATAALYGSVVTAVLGFLGIWITQKVTLKVAQIRAKKENTALRKSMQPELPFELVPGTGMTGIAMLRLDLEQAKVSIMAEQRNLLQAVLEVHKDISALHSRLDGGGHPPVL